MLFSHLAYVPVGALLFRAALTSYAPVPVVPRTQNVPRIMASADAMGAVRRALSGIGLQGGSIFDVSATLDKSWNGAVLFSFSPWVSPSSLADTHG